MMFLDPRNIPILELYESLGLAPPHMSHDWRGTVRCHACQCWQKTHTADRVCPASAPPPDYLGHARAVSA